MRLLLLLGWSDDERHVWGFEEDVAVRTHSELVASRDFDRRLDVEIAAGDLRTGLAQILADGARSDLGGAGVHQDALVALLRDGEGGREEAGEDREAQEAAVVAVYFVAEAGVPRESRPTIPLRSIAEASGKITRLQVT